MALLFVLGAYRCAHEIQFGQRPLVERKWPRPTIVAETDRFIGDGSIEEQAGARFCGEALEIVEIGLGLVGMDVDADGRTEDMIRFEPLGVRDGIVTDDGQPGLLLANEPFTDQLRPDFIKPTDDVETVIAAGFQETDEVAADPQTASRSR